MLMSLGSKTGRKIKFRRGKKVDLPILDRGEPAFTTDTNEFFIGGNEGNIEFVKKEIVDALEQRVLDLEEKVKSLEDMI